MATYLPNITDNLPEPEMFQPNFGFIAKAMGAKQARYDRNFNSVQNLYNSSIHGELSNSENKEHRAQAYKSIEGQIKKIRTLDLSQSQNVAAAKGFFDPIVNDQELVLDMQKTKQLKTQFAEAERVRNSTEGDEKDTYNHYSVMNLNHALEDLKSAKRGKGSIGKINIPKYKPYINISSYLNNQPGQEDLKIVSMAHSNGHYYKTTNGNKAVPLFTMFASKALNNPRFNEQIMEQASVQIESEIRSRMKSQNISHQEAVGMIYQQKLNDVSISSKTYANQINEELKQTNTKIHQFRKAYPNMSNNPEILKKVENLKNIKKTQEAELQKIEKDFKELSSIEPENMKNKLKTVYANTVKQQEIMGWAQTRAFKDHNVEQTLDKYSFERVQQQNRIALDNHKTQNEGRLYDHKMRVEQRQEHEQGTGDITSLGKSVFKSSTDAYNIDSKFSNTALRDIYDSTSVLMSEIAQDKKVSDKELAGLSALQQIVKGGTVNNTEMENIQTLMRNYGLDPTKAPEGQRHAGLVLNNIAQSVYKRYLRDLDSNETNQQGELYKKSIKSAGILQQKIVHYAELTDSRQESYRTVFTRKNKNTGQYDFKEGANEKVKVIGYETRLTDNGEARRIPILELIEENLSDGDKHLLNENASPSAKGSEKLSSESVYYKTDESFAERVVRHSISGSRNFGTDDEKQYDANETFQRAVYSKNEKERHKLFGEAAIFDFDVNAQQVMITFKQGADSEGRSDTLDTYHFFMDYSAFAKINKDTEALIRKNTPVYKSPIKLKELVHTHNTSSVGKDFDKEFEAFGITTDVKGWYKPNIGYVITYDYTVTNPNGDSRTFSKDTQIDPGNIEQLALLEQQIYLDLLSMSRSNNNPNNK